MLVRLLYASRAVESIGAELIDEILAESRAIGESGRSLVAGAGGDLCQTHDFALLLFLQTLKV